MSEKSLIITPSRSNASYLKLNRITPSTTTDTLYNPSGVLTYAGTPVALTTSTVAAATKSELLITIATSSTGTILDSSTYLFGFQPTSAILTSDTSRSRIIAPRSGTITGVQLAWECGTSYATAEDTALLLDVNGSTTSLSTTAKFDALGSINITGLSAAVTAGQYIRIQWQTPAWVTNPVGPYFHGFIYMQ
jgi:hypothetical protein